MFTFREQVKFMSQEETALTALDQLNAQTGLESWFKQQKRLG